MQSLQLYIDGTQAEMFRDESVQLTQTIQNIKDIGSIFTDFSRSFNLPASKVNNKLFKHYYNWQLRDTPDTSTFNANNTLPAELHLNNRTFKKGYIALGGVQLKNGKAYSYGVTFFGETIDLKRQLKETKLSNIFESITTYDHEYSTSNVVTGLQTGLASNAIRYPLIVNGTGAETFGSNRLFYNSSTHTAGDNNLHYNGTNSGVKKSMLKPALKVEKIIDAIESQTTLEFTKTAADDFFNPSNSTYDKLYLWLSRTKGNIGLNVTGTAEINMPITDIDLSDPANPAEWTPSITNGIFSFQPSSTTYEELYVDLTFSINSTSAYTMLIEEVTGDTVIRASENVEANAGTRNISYTIEAPSGQGQDVLRSFRFRVTSTDATITFTPTINFNRIEEIIDDPYEPPIVFDDEAEVTGSFITPNGAVSNIVVADQVPDIKVIDFLTGLFKMFNLTAYVQTDGKIKVQTLDTFYDTADSYDISEFVDTETSSVEFGIPYQEIAFRYADPKTFLSINFKELFNKTFGNLENTTVDSSEVQTTNRGDKYVVKLPFGKMLYERLNDSSDGSSTPFQYGYCTDKDQNPINIQPLILAIENINVTAADRLSFQDGAGSGTPAGLTTYNRPCNVFDINGTKYSINFGEEIDEFTGVPIQNSLFYEYYRNYVVDTFNPRRRLTKLTAYLPLRILLNYSLADTFVINGKQYKINSINTDFTTGKSELELLNILRF